jgi:hypothetical protein
MSSFRKYSITFENKASSFFNRRSICSQCWYLITASHRPQKPDPERSYIRWTIQAVFFENKALLTPVANKSHAHHFVLLHCAFWMTQCMTESKLNEDFWRDSQLEAENKAVDLTENKIYREKSHANILSWNLPITLQGKSLMLQKSQSWCPTLRLPHPWL